MQSLFKSIPSVDKSVTELLGADPSLVSIPHSLLADLAGAYWRGKREQIKAGICVGPFSLASELPTLLQYVRSELNPKLRSVINATGVVIHTNLGRSVLSDKACAAVLQAARGYTNLEMDLATGERGSRHELTRGLICRLTGAEDAMVVNNNAAAVLLLLDTICAGGETIVSRGELVEIGGSFRIPDIMAKSGTMLKEVGTTNRTHFSDYLNAITETTRAIMRVHTSNYRIIGFHKETSLSELKKLAAKNSIPLLVDLGSGNLLDFSKAGLSYEPTPREVIDQGADCVCFSGDKLLGGPQAGLIAGKKEIIEKLKQNPLARALRCDKLCLAALEATLSLYLDPQTAKNSVPTPAMINMGEIELAKNARSLAKSIRKAFREAQINCGVSFLQESSRVGGGAFPEFHLPTTLVSLTPRNITSSQLKDRLLKTSVPVIGRLEKNTFCLDPRTITRDEYKIIPKMLVDAFKDA